ncbi:MAG: hypothetical protein HQL94_04265 [Magnetococcales bacterium]|nr:hypothetical protein [Magnetococcales bacterium]MBF0439083.1 hypothetical protein [Magnetococcales bacterium]
MSLHESSESHTEFRLQDPIKLFETFSTEEMERRRQTDPNFNADLYQEARQLVLSRLHTGHFREISA